MNEKTKTKEPSLLDSVHYRNALRVNFLESNRQEKIAKRIQSDRHDALADINRECQNIHQWKTDIQKSTESVDLTKYTKLLEAEENENSSVSECYFMYGICIGKRPKLMKNFLGRQSTAHRLADNKCHRESSTQNERENSATSSEEAKETERYREIMIDNKIVRQVPIGYNSSCVRKRVFFSHCTSHTMKRCNTLKPGYYTLRYNYVLPPTSMHR